MTRETGEGNLLECHVIVSVLRLFRPSFSVDESKGIEVLRRWRNWKRTKYTLDTCRFDVLSETLYDYLWFIHRTSI